MMTITLYILGAILMAMTSSRFTDNYKLTDHIVAGVLWPFVTIIIVIVVLLDKKGK